MKGPSLRQIGWVVTFLYLLTVAFMVFWPVHIDSGQVGGVVQETVDTGHSQGWLPLWYGYSHVEWTSNLLMFLPGGFLFTLLLQPARPWLVPLGGLAATASIETIQLLMPGRTSSPLDILANALGCVIGWVLALGLLKIVGKHKKKAEI